MSQAFDLKTANGDRSMAKWMAKANKMREAYEAQDFDYIDNAIERLREQQVADDIPPHERSHVADLITFAYQLSEGMIDGDPHAIHPGMDDGTLRVGGQFDNVSAGEVKTPEEMRSEAAELEKAGNKAKAKSLRWQADAIERSEAGMAKDDEERRKFVKKMEDDAVVSEYKSAQRLGLTEKLTEEQLAEAERTIRQNTRTALNAHGVMKDE